MKHDFISVQKESISVYHHKQKQYIEIIKGGSCYGLSWNKNQEIYVSSNKDLQPLNLKERKLSNTIWSKGREIHQILFHKNLFYVANTGHNIIHLVSPTRDIKKIIDAEPNVDKPTHGEGDKDHINSIFIYDNRIYLCCHNRDNPSLILVLDINFDIIEKFENVGKQCHNVYVENETLYTLSSKTCEVTKINLKTKKKEFIPLKLKNFIEFDGNFFIRGLARTKNNFLIGVTSFSTAGSERDNHNGWIIETDNNFNIVDVVTTPGVSAVNEIRIINEIDYAHSSTILELTSEEIK